MSMSEKNLFCLILADLMSSSVSHLFQAPSPPPPPHNGRKEKVSSPQDAFAPA